MGVNAMHGAAEGGHIEVIKFLLPLFGERVHEKANNSCTMLHYAAEMGHCQIACYLIDEVHLDPQARDKVRGVPGDYTGVNVQDRNVSSVCVLVYTACCDKIEMCRVYVC